ncbi:MAG: hypothetical protein ACHP7M_05445 [Burkholderiales bacterium]|jgi:hypothetical protein
MTGQHRFFAYFIAVVLALAAAGCATTPLQPPVQDLRAPTQGSVLRSLSIEPGLEDRILALDPEHIGDGDVRNMLARGPTPRIVEVHGGVYPVYLLMESFAQFLIGMGYPENRIRDPGDGAYSRSPYEDSERQAGEIAWFYEHEGVRPMLVGHSQGGIQVITILHELAGTFGAARRVFNPLSDRFEDRTTIVDPLTGRDRPVVGVSVAYASVVGTGGWALALPSSWKVIPVVRSIPDTVDEFTGYRIGLDLFAWDAPWLEAAKTFRADGRANVRNVTLPAEYSHVFVAVTAPLAESPAMRAWINDFDPDHEAGRAPLPDGVALNVMWAADVWHSIKRHWCLEAQRLIRARRAALGR